ncbi:MAG: cation-transporting P-type ATPase [Pseudomonadota bacterium]
MIVATAVVDGLADPSTADFVAVALALGTDMQGGLTAEEAASRLARDGPNALRAVRQRPTWRRALSQLQDPLVGLLLTASGAGDITGVGHAPDGQLEAASAWHGLFANHWLWGAVALSALLQVAVVQVTLLNSAFGTVPLDATPWLVCIGMASPVLWLAEVRKMVHRAWTRHARSVVATPRPTSA